MKNEKVEMMITKERKNEVNIKKKFKKKIFPNADWRIRNISVIILERKSKLLKR